jgi:hypothetical protein
MLVEQLRACTLASVGVALTPDVDEDWPPSQLKWSNATVTPLVSFCTPLCTCN